MNHDLDSKRLTIDLFIPLSGRTKFLCLLASIEQQARSDLTILGNETRRWLLLRSGSFVLPLLKASWPTPSVYLSLRSSSTTGEVIRGERWGSAHLGVVVDDVSIRGQAWEDGIGGRALGKMVEKEMTILPKMIELVKVVHRRVSIEDMKKLNAFNGIAMEFFADFEKKWKI